MRDNLLTFVRGFNKHKWHILLTFGCLAFVGVYGILPVLRASLVSHPNRKPLRTDSLEISFEYENVEFETSEHLKVRGWYSVSHNQAAVIVAHGYGGNRADYVEPAEVLVELGYGVLLVDLLAHGESEGTRLVLDGQEILAAVDYLTARPEIDSQRIGAWGFSLGGLVSLQAAAQEEEIRAVIADGPFPVIAGQDMPSPDRISDWLWVPFDWVQLRALKLFGVSAAMSTTEALSRIGNRPVLLVSGIENEGERRVMQKYAESSGGVVELWEVNGAGHVESWWESRAKYEEKAVAFFEQALLKDEEIRP